MENVKYFGSCNGEAVLLLNPGRADHKHDFERLIGRLVITNEKTEKMVRDCQLFAIGTCSNCGKIHVVEWAIFNERA